LQGRILDDGNKRYGVVDCLGNGVNVLHEAANSLLNLSFQLERHDVANRNNVSVSQNAIEKDHPPVVVQQPANLVF
jgi:hypothetical protein